jgi:hypothetical protein
MRTGRVRKLANRDSQSLFVRGQLFDPVEVETWRHRARRKCHERLHDLPGTMCGPSNSTTDGHRAYINAVADAFGPSNIDYATRDAASKGRP